MLIKSRRNQIYYRNPIDRSKRRLSLPMSGLGPNLSSRKSSLASTDGDRKPRRGSGDRRRSSFSSLDSWSSYDSEEESLPHPREREHVNSKVNKNPHYF